MSRGYNDKTGCCNTCGYQGCGYCYGYRWKQVAEQDITKAARAMVTGYTYDNVYIDEAKNFKKAEAMSKIDEDMVSKWGVTRFVDWQPIVKENKMAKINDDCNMAKINDDCNWLVGWNYPEATFYVDTVGELKCSAWSSTLNREKAKAFVESLKELVAMMPEDD